MYFYSKEKTRLKTIPNRDHPGLNNLGFLYVPVLLYSIGSMSRREVYIPPYSGWDVPLDVFFAVPSST